MCEPSNSPAGGATVPSVRGQHLSPIKPSTLHSLPFLPPTWRGGGILNRLAPVDKVSVGMVDEATVSEG